MLTSSLTSASDLSNSINKDVKVYILGRNKISALTKQLHITLIISLVSKRGYGKKITGGGISFNLNPLAATLATYLPYSSSSRTNINRPFAVAKSVCDKRTNTILFASEILNGKFNFDERISFTIFSKGINNSLCW